MDHLQANNCIVPLRFIGFQNDGKWEVKRLGDIAIRVNTKNLSDSRYPVLTNSATEGIVNQQDYFDREIVTKDNLKNYSIVELDDFVYNPRISTAAPVGPISRNKIGRGIMSPLYTIFRFKEGNIDFFEHYFNTNCWHQYLKDIANFGARFDRMNITSEDFMNLPIPFPPLAEQKRIAECLSSMDKMIAECNNKLKLLKSHKKGLMQQLFASLNGGGKSLIPRLRFQKFKNTKEWEIKTLGKISNTFSGGTPSAGNKNYYGGNIPFIRSGELNSDCTSLFLTQEGLNNSSAKIVERGTILYALYGATSGEVGISQMRGAINQAILAITPNDGYDSLFIYYYLKNQKESIVNQYIQGGQGNLSGTIINALRFPIPSLDEQHKIADCLSPIDKMIGYYSDKTFLLGLHKKGLMQQLFPKQ